MRNRQLKRVFCGSHSQRYEEELLEHKDELSYANWIISRRFVVFARPLAVFSLAEGAEETVACRVAVSGTCGPLGHAYYADFFFQRALWLSLSLFFFARMMHLDVSLVSTLERSGWCLITRKKSSKKSP